MKKIILAIGFMFLVPSVYAQQVSYATHDGMTASATVNGAAASVIQGNMSKVFIRDTLRPTSMVIMKRLASVTVGVGEWRVSTEERLGDNKHRMRTESELLESFKA